MPAVWPSPEPAHYDRVTIPERPSRAPVVLGAFVLSALSLVGGAIGAIIYNLLAATLGAN